MSVQMDLVCPICSWQLWSGLSVSILDTLSSLHYSSIWAPHALHCIYPNNILQGLQMGNWGIAILSICETNLSHEVCNRARNLIQVSQVLDLCPNYWTSFRVAYLGILDLTAPQFNPTDGHGEAPISGLFCQSHQEAPNSFHRWHGVIAIAWGMREVLISY